MVRAAIAALFHLLLYLADTISNFHETTAPLPISMALLVCPGSKSFFSYLFADFDE